MQSKPVQLTFLPFNIKDSGVCARECFDHKLASVVLAWVLLLKLQTPNVQYSFAAEM